MCIDLPASEIQIVSLKMTTAKPCNIEFLYAFPTIFAFCLDLPRMSIALKRRSG